MFIRVKTIKNQKYAYRVENKWKKRKKNARQKVKGYLGKVIQLTPTNNTTFEEFTKQPLEQYLKTTKPKQIVRDIVALELHKHGFKRKRATYTLKDIKVNFPTLKVLKNNSSIVLNINNDFLCNYTLRKLINFRSTSDQQTVANEFAKAFIQAGIPVQQEIFIHLFNKIYHRGVSQIK